MNIVINFTIISLNMKKNMINFTRKTFKFGNTCDYNFLVNFVLFSYFQFRREAQKDIAFNYFFVYARDFVFIVDKYEFCKVFVLVDFKDEILRNAKSS